MKAIVTGKPKAVVKKADLLRKLEPIYASQPPLEKESYPHEPKAKELDAMDHKMWEDGYNHCCSEIINRIKDMQSVFGYIDTKRVIKIVLEGRFSFIDMAALNTVANHIFDFTVLRYYRDAHYLCYKSIVDVINEITGADIKLEREYIWRPDTNYFWL